MRSSDNLPDLEKIVTRAPASVIRPCISGETNIFYILMILCLHSSVLDFENTSICNRVKFIGGIV